MHKINENTANTRHYTITVIGDIDPELSPPFENEQDRDQDAQNLRKEDKEGRNGIFWLDIDENGMPVIGSYSGAFFEKQVECC